jgi:SAM-dependent methyltransferase
MPSRFYDIVIPLVRDKSVLDAGSIGHSYSGRDAYKTWNFGILSQHASKIKGFDILAEDVEQARRDGYDIEVGDAESYLTEDCYDVVFVGDLIEHLSNPGLFLECCHRNLAEGGRLVIATPNTYSFAKLARVALRRTNEPPVNPEHVCYYTPLTLEQAVIRHGFRLVSLQYCSLDYADGHGSAWKRAQLSVNGRLSTWLPRFSQTMVAVFARVPSAAA